MAIQRMDNVAIVVDDLDAAVRFFTELGMELEGKGSIEGLFADRTVGLDGVRSDIAMMRTPDGPRRPPDMSCWAVPGRPSRGCHARADAGWCCTRRHSAGRTAPIVLRSSSNLHIRSGWRHC